MPVQGRLTEADPQISTDYTENRTDKSYRTYRTYVPYPSYSVICVICGNLWTCFVARDGA